ncbi:hypothetical protein F5B17DRAFT_58613 [Nemania serpens]|nr:hypothetical protein F5B17DRAFT_58613 [Nemania serpens]
MPLGKLLGRPDHLLLSLSSSSTALPPPLLALHIDFAKVLELGFNSIPLSFARIVIDTAAYFYFFSAIALISPSIFATSSTCAEWGHGLAASVAETVKQALHLTPSPWR